MSRLNLGLARLALIGLLVMVGSSGLDVAQSNDATGPAGTGALAGRVSLWPSAPVERSGVPAPRRPAPGAKIMVYGPGHQEIAAVTTDEEGDFRVQLPPGTYLVELAPDRRGFTKNLPATVTITSGQETHLQILLDTGLR